MKLFKLLSSAKDQLNRRTVKVSNGKSDVRTSLQAAPHGIDANPVKDMVAIYARTEQDGREVVIGYINKDVLAEVGETRVFSTNSSGVTKFNAWLRAAGELLLGTSNTPSAYTNFAVKFNELKTEFNLLKTSHNNLVTLYNSHVHPVPGVTAGPTTVSSSPTPSSGSANSSNIDNCKHEKIKYSD